MSTHVKIMFELEANVSGQREIESVWALPVEDGFQIDNIPFYACEVALGDVIKARPDENGTLWFEGLVRASGHSTVRLWFASEADVRAKRDELHQSGCSSELSELPRLVAVDIPPEVSYEQIKVTLDEGESSGQFEYEEACLGFLE